MEDPTLQTLHVLKNALLYQRKSVRVVVIILRRLSYDTEEKRMLLSGLVDLLIGPGKRLSNEGLRGLFAFVQQELPSYSSLLKMARDICEEEKNPMVKKIMDVFRGTPMTKSKCDTHVERLMGYIRPLDEWYILVHLETIVYKQLKSASAVLSALESIPWIDSPLPKKLFTNITRSCMMDQRLKRYSEWERLLSMMVAHLGPDGPVQTKIRNKMNIDSSKLREARMGRGECERVIWGIIADVNPDFVQRDDLPENDICIVKHLLAEKHAAIMDEHRLLSTAMHEELCRTVDKKEHRLLSTAMHEELCRTVAKKEPKRYSRARDLRHRRIEALEEELRILSTMVYV